MLVCLGVLSLAVMLGLAGCKRRNEVLKLQKEAHRVRLFEGDPARAEQLYLKVIEMDPTLTHPHIELAELYLDPQSETAGLYSEDKALRHLREAIRLAPKHIAANYLMGVIALRRGDVDSAIEAFGTTRGLFDWHLSLRRPPMWGDVLLYEGLLLLDKGDIDRAVANFEECLSVARGRSCYHVGLLLAAVKRGDAAELDRHAGWVSRSVNLSDRGAYTGLLHLLRGEPQRAIAVFEETIKSLEWYAARMEQSEAKRINLKRQKFYRQLLAWAYWKAGKHEEAHTLYPGNLEGFSPPATEIYTLVLIGF
jgi:tetratricopeptide (TPR) repeat protein